MSLVSWMVFACVAASSPCTPTALRRPARAEESPQTHGINCLAREHSVHETPGRPDTGSGDA
ncbi:hypothetical protein ACR6C2_00630 [Streptomyces sp. INA 01156]